MYYIQNKKTSLFQIVLERTVSIRIRRWSRISSSPAVEHLSLAFFGDIDGLQQTAAPLCVQLEQTPPCRCPVFDTDREDPLALLHVPHSQTVKLSPRRQLFTRLEFMYIGIYIN